MKSTNKSLFRSKLFSFLYYGKIPLASLYPLDNLRVFFQFPPGWEKILLLLPRLFIGHELARFPAFDRTMTLSSTVSFLSFFLIGPIPPLPRPLKAQGPPPSPDASVCGYPLDVIRLLHERTSSSVSTDSSRPTDITNISLVLGSLCSLLSPVSDFFLNQRFGTISPPPLFPSLLLVYSGFCICLHLTSLYFVFYYPSCLEVPALPSALIYAVSPRNIFPPVFVSSKDIRPYGVTWVCSPLSLRNEPP